MQGFGKRQIYFLFFIFGFIIILINFFVSYYQIGKEIEKDFIDSSKKILLFDELIIKSRIEHYEKEIKVLSNSAFTKNFVRGYIKGNTDLIQTNNTYLMDLAKAHTDMMQIRYLCNEGREIVRIDRKTAGKEPFLVSSDELQNKKDRYYFQEISQMNEGEVWYSDIDLNIEHGKIQVPYQPTLRIGMPVFVKGKRQGMMIVNIFMENILKQLLVTKNYQVYLTDKEGNFLLHPNSEYNWSKNLGKKHTLVDEFPDLEFEVIREGFTQNRETFSKKLTLGKSTEYYLTAKLNNQHIHEKKEELIRKFSLIAFVVMIITFPFALIIMHNVEHLSARLAAIIDSLGDGIFILNNQEKASYINNRTSQLLGYSAYEILGHKTHKLFQHGDADGRYIKEENCPIHNVNQTKQQFHCDDNTFVTKGGERINIEYTTTPFFVNNKFEGSITLFRDITHRKIVEADIKKFLKIVEQIDDIVTVTDPEGVITYVNDAFSKYTGYSKEEAVGKKPNLYKSDKHTTSEIKELWNTILSGKVYRGIIINKKKNGEFYDEEKTITPLLDEKGEIISFVSTGKDITDRVRMKGELEKLASTDYLTGLYNRFKFEEYLKQESSRCKRYNKFLSLIMFDIDHFKKVNDTFGHDVGDSVLKEISTLVGSHIRQSDVFARWGGEEFMLLTPETDLGSAHLLAEKLRKAVCEYNFLVAGRISCSLGVVQIKEDEESTSVYQRVDSALYAAKKAGRNQTVRG